MLHPMVRDVGGMQLRNAISARSNLGLGFALTHLVAEAGEPHRTKSNHDLAVAPGIDSFGVELVYYPFIFHHGLASKASVS